MKNDAGRSASEPRLVAKSSWSIRDLDRLYAPDWRHPNKRHIFERVQTRRRQHSGQVRVSRWRRPSALPSSVKCSSVTLRRGWMEYPAEAPSRGSVRWHLNFADPMLFVAAAGPLLAQDEHQVVEHPRLASLALAMKSATSSCRGMSPRTVDAGGPTPILIEGVHRECDLDLSSGLYGNAFARASLDEVNDSLSILRGPTLSNILAVSALPPERGNYTRDQIRWLFTAAFTAFRAAVLTSGSSVVVHTGLWGCGVFGGNRVLLPAIQFLAAGSAQVKELIFSAGMHERSLERAQSALNLADRLSETCTEEALLKLHSMKFQWGVGDGN